MTGKNMKYMKHYMEECGEVYHNISVNPDYDIHENAKCSIVICKKASKSLN